MSAAGLNSTWAFRKEGWRLGLPCLPPGQQGSSHPGTEWIGLFKTHLTNCSPGQCQGETAPPTCHPVLLWPAAAPEGRGRALQGGSESTKG